MEDIYKVWRGPCWDEYDIGYLTKEKLEKYLDSLYQSTWVKHHIEMHMKHLDDVEAEARKKRQEAIDATERCKFQKQLTPKDDPEYKLFRRKFKETERAIIQENNTLQKIANIKSEIATWGRDDWLEHADYHWEIIKINNIDELEHPDDDRESEDWM